MALWTTIIKRKNLIEKIIKEREYYQKLLSDLQFDEGIDRYQDMQPGGGNCISENRKKQQYCEEKLTQLYNVRTLFPQMKSKDVMLMEDFLLKLEDMDRGPEMFENWELADQVEQGFLFYSLYFPSYQFNKKTIDDFFRIGKKIVKETVAFDSDKESFFRKKPVSFNI